MWTKVEKPVYNILLCLSDVYINLCNRLRCSKCIFYQLGASLYLDKLYFCPCHVVYALRACRQTVLRNRNYKSIYIVNFNIKMHEAS